jgi:hypothetical protein
MACMCLLYHLECSGSHSADEEDEGLQRSFCNYLMGGMFVQGIGSKLVSSKSTTHLRDCSARMDESWPTLYIHACILVHAYIHTHTHK